MQNYLKKLAVLSIVAVGILFTSCSQDTTAPESTSYSVSGKITDVDGKPKEDVKLIVNGKAKTETSAKGKWSLDNLTGEVTITPQKTNLTFNPGSISVSSSDDENTYNFTASLRQDISATEFTIDSNTKYQKIYGFGASVAYYEGWLADHPYKDEIYDIVFKDLGINILRLQDWYGKDSDAVANGADIAKNATKSLGHPIKVLLTSWEMPEDLQSEDRDPSEDGQNITLKKVEGAYAYDQFADYWLNSLQAYKRAGVDPDYISIQNEPDYWPKGRFMPTETNKYAGYGKALNAVYTELQSKIASPPKIVGPEVAVISNNKVEGYTKEMNLSQISAIAFHLYGPLPTDQVAKNNFNNINDEYKDKPIFQTEFSNINKRAINTAVFIHTLLVEGNVNAYLFWELVWADGGGGLVALQNPYDKSQWTKDKGYYKSERYYSVQHYSKFIRPDFYRVSINQNKDNVKASAYVSPDGKEIVAVLINNNFEAKDIKINFTNFSYSSSEIYKTVFQRGGNKFKNIGSVSNNIVHMPLQSVITIRYIK